MSLELLVVLRIDLVRQLVLVHGKFYQEFDNLGFMYILICRQRTGTRILAEVVHTMRAVQTRMEPFMQQYHDILQTDPQFNSDLSLVCQNHINI